jgi:hypothetical protein
MLFEWLSDVLVYNEKIVKEKRYKSRRQTISQKIRFFQTENRKVKQVLSGGWYQWEGGGYKERVKEAECSRNIMCYVWKWKNETTPGIGMEGVNSTMIYYKNFCKYHSVPQYNNNIIKKKKQEN